MDTNPTNQAPEPQAPESPQSSQSSQSAPSAPQEETEPLFSLAEMEEAIAQAEEKGYKRGRNESISRLMERPGPKENPVVEETPLAAGDTAGGFLSRIRPSVWDM